MVIFEAKNLVCAVAQSAAVVIVGRIIAELGGAGHICEIRHTEISAHDDGCDKSGLWDRQCRWTCYGRCVGRVFWLEVVLVGTCSLCHTVFVFLTFCFRF